MALADQILFLFALPQIIDFRNVTGLCRDLQKRGRGERKLAQHNQKSQDWIEAKKYIDSLGC